MQPRLVPLPPVVDPAEEVLPPPVEWTPDFVARWNNLNRMMSQTAVRALLGEPKWIDRRSTPHIEYWLYKDPTIQGEGWVAFLDRGGPVYKWWGSGRR